MTRVMISFELPHSHYNNNNLTVSKNIKRLLTAWSSAWNIDYTYKSTAINLHVYFECVHDCAVFRLTWPHSQYRYTVFVPNEVGTYVAQ